MHVSDMVFEVTRRCNLRCSHCMRGCSQQVDMDAQTIHNALRDVESIGCLTITGGEPSLKPEIIHQIWQELLWQKVDVEYFYIVTNAHSTRGRREFLRELDRLYEWSSEKEMCSLVVSQDQYHRWAHEPNFKYYTDEYFYDEDTGEEFYRPYIHLESRREDIYKVINEGLAEQFQLGSEDPRPQHPWDVSYWNENMHVSGSEHGQTVYISANGNVTSCCDMSYKRIDKERKGNVNEESLSNIILGYCVKEEEELKEAV
jgi:organic radical activating enzyme